MFLKRVEQKLDISVHGWSDSFFHFHKHQKNFVLSSIYIFHLCLTLKGLSSWQSECCKSCRNNSTLFKYNFTKKFFIRASWLMLQNMLVASKVCSFIAWNLANHLKLKELFGCIKIGVIKFLQKNYKINYIQQKLWWWKSCYRRSYNCCRAKKKRNCW